MLEYEVKELLLVHIFKESYYSNDYLNQKIAGLELGYMEIKDRPSTITHQTLCSNDHKLKQESTLFCIHNACTQLCTHTIMYQCSPQLKH